MTFEQNMRNFLRVVLVALVGWTSNAQAQSLTIDPESIVPLAEHVRHGYAGA